MVSLEKGREEVGEEEVGEGVVRVMGERERMRDRSKGVRVERREAGRADWREEARGEGREIVMLYRLASVLVDSLYVIGRMRGMCVYVCVCI